MELDSLVFIAKAEVILTLDEVQALMDLAATHYDGACIAAGQHGGFIYGWYNLVTFSSANQRKVPVRVTWDQFDLVAKILEQPHTPMKLRKDWLDLFDRLRDAQRKLSNVAIS
jgi:hypothetical protein